MSKLEIYLQIYVHFERFLHVNLSRETWAQQKMAKNMFSSSLLKRSHDPFLHFTFHLRKCQIAKCHCHKYCDIMLHHCRSLSFGLTRWHSWRSCPSRRPVSKVGLECWQNHISTFSTWLIGLNQYFFKPYYSCSSTLTGTTENLIVVCTSPPCHSRWGPTPVLVPAQALQCFPH